MRILKFNFWKITSLILFVLVIFVGMKYFQEYKKNLPYKKELKNFQMLAEKTEEESLIFKRQILAQKDPLDFEKEKKDKFGEALEGEKVISIYDDLLKSITFPFLSK
jgi:hypothetical protein